MNFPAIINLRASVSVVIPVYNSGNTAIHAIESVLSQTTPCAEIIVIDDGSTDGSAELIKDRFRDRSELIHIFSIENGGAAAARNFGISKSNSEWIAFLDSDDLWFSNKLEVQLNEIINDPAISLIGTLTTMRDFFTYSSRPRGRLVVIALRTLLFKNYFQTSTVILRHTVLRELGGFPSNQRYCEEVDLFMRIAAKYKCVLINEVFVDYAGGKRGFGAMGLSANLWAMECGELRNIYRVWYRGSSGVVVAGAALAYSVVKFLRRVFIKLVDKITSHPWR